MTGERKQGSTAIIKQDGPPEVEYPEDHSPFCRKDCDHPCHDPYDAWVTRKNGSSAPTSDDT